MSFLEILAVVHIIMCIFALRCALKVKEDNWIPVLCLMFVPFIGPFIVIVAYFVYVSEHKNLK